MNHETIGVVGLGFLGRGIAACLVAYQFKVIAFDPQQGTEIERAIDDAMRELAEHGEIDQSNLDSWRDRYQAAKSLEAFRDCDFVIESATENVEIKHRLLEQLEPILRPDIPLVSNTSSIPISLMQKWLKHPQRFAGMHWAGPAHVYRFLEVIRGEQTNDATMTAVLDLAKRVGKDPAVINRDIEGFIVNRLCYAMYREAFHLLETGVGDVESIDKCWRNVVGPWASIAGPFRWMDLTGCSVYARGMRQIFPTLCNSTDLPKTILKMEEAGAFGTQNGRGFYDYDEAEAKRWDEMLRDAIWRARQVQENI